MKTDSKASTNKKSSNYEIWYISIGLSLVYSRWYSKDRYDLKTGSEKVTIYGIIKTYANHSFQKLIILNFKNSINALFILLISGNKGSWS